MDDKNYIDTSKIKAVIFDVDGTLYDQKKLRSYVFKDILKFLVCFPWRLKDILIILKFRKIREELSDTRRDNVCDLQYTETALKTNSLPSKVKELVDHWIMTVPNKYLGYCVFPDTNNFFKVLKDNGVKIGIFSDYPFAEKLEAMSLPYDEGIDSTDKEVNTFKPNSKGLKILMDRMNISASECLFVGDRFERDGLCAESLNVKYLIKSNESEEANKFSHYRELINIWKNQ